MSRQAVPILTLSHRASANLTANRFVSYAGGVPSANGATIGVARADAASGTMASVDILGTAVVETGGAITALTNIATDASGKAVAYSSGVKVGVALQAASGAGEFIEVLLVQNVA